MATSYDDPPPDPNSAVPDLGRAKPIQRRKSLTPATDCHASLPGLVAAAGDAGVRRFFEFFTATIRNRNTRAAYVSACSQFLGWCEARGITSLASIQPMAVAAYIESHPGAAPTVKQHLAAIRTMFDWLVTGQIVPSNPAHSVRGPKHVVGGGSTPVLDAQQARALLDSIPLVNRDGTPDLAWLRDRALIGVMVFSFARLSAAASKNTLGSPCRTTAASPARDIVHATSGTRPRGPCVSVARRSAR